MIYNPALQNSEKRAKPQTNYRFRKTAQNKQKQTKNVNCRKLENRKTENIFSKNRKMIIIWIIKWKHRCVVSYFEKKPKEVFMSCVFLSSDYHGDGTYSGLIGLLLNKKLIKNKKFYRPTDPLFFRHVTGNTGIFLAL